MFFLPFPLQSIQRLLDSSTYDLWPAKTNIILILSRNELYLVIFKVLNLLQLRNISEVMPPILTFHHISPSNTVFSIWFWLQYVVFSKTT